MLKLTRMELAGFKSFYQRTAISFPDGITAVVGPNGCGKSNISDAISWVLGEQSSKSLRGTKMQDVIFNGSARRGPLPMAEVKLTLTWSGGPPPAPEDHPHPAMVAAAPPAALASAGSNGNGNGHRPLEAAPQQEGRLSGDGGAAAGEASSDGAAGSAAGVDVSGGTASGTEGVNGGDARSAPRRPVFAIPTEDGSAMTVMRRLFRNGDSEYRIDDTRCRLRDIQDLLQSASIGARTYAVIEQGRVQTLLSARPKERKELIDEAAGILGFKARKRSALLKLESTEANLSRLRDLISEVKRQVNSLKRQASTARRHQRNADEIRRHRRILFHREHADLARAKDDLGRARDDLRQALAEVEARLSREEAAVEALRQRLDEEGRGAGERREELHETQRAIDRLDATVSALAGRVTEARARSAERTAEATTLDERSQTARAQSQEAAARRDEATAELADRRAALGRLEQQYTGLLAAADEASRQAEVDRDRVLSAVSRLGEARNHAARLTERGARLAHQRTRLAREEAECRADADRLDEQASTAQRRLTDAAGALTDAERLAVASAGAATAREADLDAARERQAAARREQHALRERRDALVAVLQPDGADTPLPGEPVALDVEVDPEWEAAAGTGLNDLVRARVVDDIAAARTALEAASHQAGHPLTLICRELTTAVSRPDGTRLSAHLRGTGAALLAAAAGDPEIVDDLCALFERWRARPGRAYVARSGETISAAGVLRGGRPGEAAGMLACNRQRRETAERLAACERQLPALDVAVHEAEASCEAARTRREETREARETAAAAVLEARLLQDRVMAEQERIERRRTVLREEASVLSAEEAGLKTETAASAATLAAAEAERDAVSRAGEASQARLDGLRRRIEALAADCAEARSSVAARQEALHSLVAAVERLDANDREFAQQAVERRDEAVALSARADRQQEEMAELAEQREAKAREMVRLMERCRADEMTQQASSAALAEAESRARSGREAVDVARQALQAKEIEHTRATAEFDHLEKECQEQFGCTPEALGATLDAEERDVPLDEVRSRLARLEEIRDRIGQVNMMAVEQFAEAEERQAFLLSQQEDLDNSIASLHATLDKINQTSRERFLHALEQIRTEFHSIFTHLFGGGRADIVLQDPDDVLDSGIDIIAQPPGKRTQSINLLSGGEKALSAIALLFAIFRHRPSPFCLLDEVDAPLDEANVDRFARLVQDYGEGTQFILITHNRRSMEIANAMYGVTMSEPGVSQTVSMRLD
ncbi:MAG: chromosome segregation protein SMC [Acidobacteriota bacterium]